MPLIHLETVMRAPVEVCFDLARSVEAHITSTSKTHERAVGGVTTGLLALGDTVTWEAVHLGIKQRLTSKISRFEPPDLFEDELVRGAFHSFKHTHEFRRLADGTLMVDTFQFVSPLGILGRLADVALLERYMRALLTERALVLKAMAESEANRKFGTAQRLP